MSNSKNKRKTVTAITATAVTAAVLLTGTYAWQNLNQEALNKAADAVNPGGRLHDDFNGTNKDIYVENFADEDIYARIQLTEYMEIGQNAGKDLATSADERGVKVVTTGADYNDKTTWQIHTLEGNETDEYWTWTMGGSTVYMPTFNMNKDSLEAEINGTFEGEDETDGEVEGDQNDRYSDYETYTVGQTETGAEIYDADTNRDDEGDQAVEGTNITTVADQTHEAKDTLMGEVISMSDWMNLTEEEKEEGYWVYDEDGWAYWSKPIETKTATGLLLDEIEMTGVSDDNWYYAINVVAQFITANDIGIADDTGFYDTSKGTVPSDNALALLESIGVNTTDEGNDEVEGEDQIIINYDDSATYGTTGYLTSSDTLQLTATVITADGQEADLTTIEWEMVDDPQNKATVVKNDEGALLSVNGDASITEPYYITIKATYGNSTGTAKFLVAENGISTSVSYTGSETTFYINENYTYTASAVSDSESVTVIDSWEWNVLEDNGEGELVETSNASIIDGVFTATAPGTYTIEAYPTGEYTLCARTTVTVYELIPLSLPADFVSVGDDSSDHPSVIVTLGGDWTNADVEWYLDTGSGARTAAQVVEGEETGNTATVQHIGGACAGGGTLTLTVTSTDGTAKGSIGILFDC